MSGRIGIMHPGQMGASVAAAARAGGREVLWASESRSADTGARAAEAGARDVGGVTALCAASGLIVSVCPPAFATDVAKKVAATGFTGVYVDANAVAPSTARSIGEVVRLGGARFVDGGIVGPPARTEGTTRLYLSGTDADEVGSVFAGTLLEPIVVDRVEGSTAASALKVCYAAWTKGSSALLLSVRALAVALGVERALLDEWARSQAGLEDRSARVVRGNAPKAWRFEGEMREIAAAYAEAGLPDDFHLAAATLYGRLGGFKDARDPTSVESAAAALLGDAREEC